MKKILAFMMALPMIMTLAACVKKDNGSVSTTPNATTTPSGTTIPVSTKDPDDTTTNGSTTTTNGITTTKPDTTKPDTTKPNTTKPETTVPSTTAPEDYDDPVPDFKYKHVVVVGVDGAGAYFKNAETPRLDEIFANGAITYNMITSTPSISGQCWGSLLHGVTPEYHKLTNAIAESQPYPSDSLFPSVFRVIREKMPDASLASFCHWAPINVGIIEDDINVHKVSLDTDSGVTSEAIKYVKAQAQDGKDAPTLLFIHFDEADGAGHSSGYGSQTQLKKINRQDHWIGQIYDTYKELGLLDDTLFIVTSDHGGIGNSHGGSSYTEMNVMFAAAGKTVEKGSIGEMAIRDVAAVVLHALDIDQPTTWSARVPSGLFKGVTAGERPVFILPGNEFREHESVPTPEKGSEGYITNFITDKNLIHYLPFDGDISDKCGGTTTETNKLYFIDGYFGKGVSLDDGYVTLLNYAPGTSSFTVSLWVKTFGITSDPPLFSNKNWNDGLNDGFVLAIRDKNDVRFNFGHNKNRIDLEKPLPMDYTSGWMHVMLIVDRTEEKVTIVTDFNDSKSVSIPDALKGKPLDGYNRLNIGQDGTGTYKASLSATLDEFMIFDGVFTQDDIEKLAKYYGRD